MKQITINLYSFKELSKESQRKAIDDHQEFLADLSLSDGDNYADLPDEDIIDNLECNEYLFYKDGELANCTTYVGKHEKSGSTEFKLHGEIYPVS